MSRARALLAARVGFLLLTGAFAWWGFRGRWGEVADALTATSPLGLVAAVAATVVGLRVTAVLWRHLLARLGCPIPPAPAAAVFLVGQLGKYVPGSIWSFAAQAQLGRAHRVPARTSVTASAVFLLLHTATGGLLGGSLAAAGALDVDGPRWLWASLAVGSAVALAPPVVRRLAARLAGPRASVSYGVRDAGTALGLMGAVWFAYGGAVLALLGPEGRAGLVAATGAFALSHAAGVLVVLAPAGLGAREGVLVALLGPVTGVGPAAAAALLGRVVHTVADFAAAALAWGAARVVRRSAADDVDHGAERVGAP